MQCINSSEEFLLAMTGRGVHEAYVGAEGHRERDLVFLHLGGGNSGSSEHDRESDSLETTATALGESHALVLRDCWSSR